MMTDLAQALRAYTAYDGSKLTVVETAGWASRGYAGQGLAGVAGHMYHHTATAESAFSYSDAPTLNMLIGGRSDLPGPLCNIALGRSGTVYVVAAGVANHAGTGSAGGLYRNVGNFWLIGNEMESSGVRDDWTEAQRRVMPHVAAALEAWYGDQDFIQIGHREYSDMGKIDPSYVDMDEQRKNINNLLYSAQPSVEASEEKDWLTMATKEDVKAAVREVLNEPIKRQGGESGSTSIIAETAWRTARDNRLEKRLNVIGSRVFHLWYDWHLGVPKRVFDGAMGNTVRKGITKLGGIYKDDETRTKAFADAAKKEYL